MTTPPSLLLAGAGYRYPSADVDALCDLDLAVAPGERVLLTGPTGCGKSTLLRLAGGLLGRHGQGTLRGSVQVMGHAPEALAPRARVGQLGFVSQEPNDQLIAGTVGDELAFGMESAGRPGPEIEARLPGLLAAAGLDLDLGRDPRTLSGGQTQRLVTAAAISAGGTLLLLDEPLAQLDPAGAQELLAALERLARRGLAVVMVEHRLEAALPWCSRCVVMESGRIVLDAPRPAFAAGSPTLDTLRRLGLTLPGMLDVADRLGLPGEEALHVLPPQGHATPKGQDAQPDLPAAHEAVETALLAVRDLHHRWPDGAQPALCGVDSAIGPGERVALLGGNGAGKSTLLAALGGQLGADLTRVRPDLAVVAVPQDPDLALFCPTVARELAYGPEEQGLASDAVQARVLRVAQGLSLGALLDRAPQAASRGQRLRVAVGAAVSCIPDVLLLDEPTSGQDHDQVEAMFDALDQVLGDAALVFATHDVDLALRRATRAVVLHEGRVVQDGAPAEVLAGLPQELPVLLPPLARWCQERGMAHGSAESVAARLQRGGVP